MTAFGPQATIVGTQAPQKGLSSINRLRPTSRREFAGLNHAIYTFLEDLMSQTNKAVARVCLWLVATTLSGLAAAQLSLVPSNPTPLDTVRLRWAHAGCTNPDSVRITMQANRLMVSADRIFLADCGTTQGYFDEYTVGRLPAGEYDIQLAANPPPPTLGPTL